MEILDICQYRVQCISIQGRVSDLTRQSFYLTLEITEVWSGTFVQEKISQDRCDLRAIYKRNENENLRKEYYVQFPGREGLRLLRMQET